VDRVDDHEHHWVAVKPAVTSRSKSASPAAWPMNPPWRCTTHWRSPIQGGSPPWCRSSSRSIPSRAATSSTPASFCWV